MYQFGSLRFASHCSMPVGVFLGRKFASTASVGRESLHKYQCWSLWSVSASCEYFEFNLKGNFTRLKDDFKSSYNILIIACGGDSMVNKTVHLIQKIDAVGKALIGIVPMGESPVQLYSSKLNATYARNFWQHHWNTISLRALATDP